MVFLVNVLFQDKKWGINIGQKATKLAGDVLLSIRRNETRFRNAFLFIFHINLGL